MTAPSEKLLAVVDRLDDAVHLLNAASMATGRLDDSERGALAIVIDLVLEIVEASRKDIAETAGIDSDLMETS